MFVVVEFERKECSIVPLCWLVDNQRKCYWPTVSKNETLQDYIKREVAPKAWWPKYPVVKVMNMTENYVEAGNFLQKIIEESSSSEEHVANETCYVLKDADIDNNNLKSSPVLKKRKLITSLSQSRESSDDDLSQYENDTPVKKHKQSKEKTPKSQKDDSRSSGKNIPNLEDEENRLFDLQKRGSRSPEEFTDSEDESQPQNSQLFPQVQIVPTTTTKNLSTATTVTVSDHSGSSNSVCSSGGTSTNILLKRIEYIIAVQDQQSIMLANLLRAQQSQSCLNRPENYPKLPVTNKLEYRSLEAFLTNEENFNYMKSRLACIGGTNVRNCVMNILKYLLSDKVAMKFNWAGRDKRPFKDTNTMRCIYDAMRLAFSSRETADFSDRSIKGAVQDWLKLAKHRFLSKSKE